MTIRIDRVVTRGGDGGQTSLADGSRIAKNDPRIEAMGSVDELNSIIGLLRLEASEYDALFRIQNLLFDVGSALAYPGPSHRDGAVDLETLWLESEIAALGNGQSALTSFVLPGGSPGAAWAHRARTAARHAERRVVALDGALDPGWLRFLNRLSDYFFVLARHLNDDGKADILWKKSDRIRPLS